MILHQFNENKLPSIHKYQSPWKWLDETTANCSETKYPKYCEQFKINSQTRETYYNITFLIELAGNYIFKIF